MSTFRKNRPEITVMISLVLILFLMSFLLLRQGLAIGWSRTCDPPALALQVLEL